MSADPAAAGSVTGRILTSAGTVVAGLLVEAVDRDAGTGARLGTARTDARGRYQIRLPLGESRPDLQVRVWGGDDEGRFLGESAVRYDAGFRETIDVMLRPDVLAPVSEYEALIGVLPAGLDSRQMGLSRSDRERDIDYLAGKTGWDARAVSMASLAGELSMATGNAVPPPLYYALLRAGLPADPGLLHQTSPTAVTNVWQDAIRRGVVPSSLEAELPQATAQFIQRSVQAGLGHRAVPGTSSLGELLEVALPDDDPGQQAFTELYLEHRRDPASLWAGVEAVFGADRADTLRRDGRLAELTLNNAPLVGALRSGGSPPEIADLARGGFFRPERWHELVAGTPIPDSVPGDSPEEKSTAYAELLAARVRALYPTAAVAAGVDSLLADVPEATRSAVGDFLGTHVGGFELGVEPVERFVARTPGAVLPESVLPQIRRLQRVYQLASDETTMGTLMAAGFDSARSVATLDRARFVSERAGDLGEAAARRVHDRAQQITGAVLNIAGSFLTARVAPPLGVVPQAPVLTASPAEGALAYPTLEGLFGALEEASGPDCGSVLSPAAYLVDLLQFLEQGPGGPQAAPAVLTARRPDLQHLPLSCANTNTEVPMIDLVNEILEYYVAHGLSLGDFTGHDTGAGRTAEELRADPEFVDQVAYDRLAEEYFPPPLPFHRRLEVARRLFGALGVPLASVMTTLRAGDAVDRTDAAAYGWRDIAMEELGLSRAEHRLLTDRGLSLQQIYGYPSGTAAGTVTGELTSVTRFADRVGISYLDAAALLETRFVNPDRSIRLLPPDGFTGAPAFGDLLFRRVGPDGSTTAPGPVDLVRLLRFVRLWRALGWTMDDTDAALAALPAPVQTAGPGDEAAALTSLDAGLSSALLRLGVVVPAMRRLKVTDPQAILACWAPLDTAGPASIYHRMFSGGPFAPAADGSVPGAAAEDLLAHTDALRAALGVTADEFTSVVSDLGAGAKLTLGNISTVYRRVWLARALDVAPGDLMALIRVTGLDPFGPPDPPAAGIVQLLDLVDELGAAGVTPADAVTLLWTPSAGLEGLVRGTAEALQAAFTAIDAELAVDDATAPERVHTLLAAAYGTPAADLVSAVFDRSFAVQADYRHAEPDLAPAIVEAGSQRIGYDAAAGRLWFTGPLADSVLSALKAASDASGFADAVGTLATSAADRAAVDASFAAFGPGLEAVLSQQSGLRTRLTKYATASRAADRTALVKAGLDPVVGARRRSAALEVLAAAAGTDTGFAGMILTTLGQAVDAVPGDEPGAGLEKILTALVKAAAITEAFGLTPAQFLAICADPALRVAEHGWLGQVPDGGPFLTPVLRALLRMRALSATYGPTVPTVLQEPTVEAVATLTGWDSTSLDALLTRFGKALPDLAQVEVFTRLDQAFALLKALSISAPSLLAAVTNDPGPAAVDVLQSALKARRGEGWPEVLRSVNDPVRSLRRDALVTLILRELRADPATAPIDTPDKLFEFFLIDVQMQPGATTSRVRQAISAVQLLVERILMNLEPQVPPAAIDRGRWEWMKRYRLWEANRRVFLWPENWLEPGLRNDRSAFFDQALGALLQSDLTEDSAAEALLGYLSGLEEVAKLEPCAIHYVEGTSGLGDEVAHVIGRTVGAQRHYYYRRRESGTWTPWELIPLDVEDNPVTPVFWKGRLLLFWLKMVSSAPAVQTGGASDGASLAELTPGQVKADAVRSVTVNPQAVLTWSEYYNGRWQQPKTSAVDRPTGFGKSFEVSGEAAFARTRLVLGETTEADALRLRIWGQGNETSFLLYNTHSLPLRQEDRVQAPPDRDGFADLIRDIDTSDVTLRISFTSEGVNQVTQSVLTKRDGGTYRVVTPYPYSYFPDSPQGGLLRDPWTAPFFYEDGRHVFYVSLRHPGAGSRTFGVEPPSTDPAAFFPADFAPGGPADA